MNIKDQGLIKYFREKLSVRVSAWIVLFATTIFIATLHFMMTKTRTVVQNEAISRTTQLLDENVLRMRGIMDRVEIATNMQARIVERNMDDPEATYGMFLYSKAMLKNNPIVHSHSIAFEPYYFKEYGHYFSAYARHVGDSIVVSQGGSDAYRYEFTDWYLMPQLLGHPCWTEPYVDIDVEYGTKALVASYSQAVSDKTGRVVGTIQTDIDLTWLSKAVAKRKPYPNSYTIMIGRGGAFFVHPDTTKLICQTIFTGTLEHPDTARVALGRAMLRGEEGMRCLEVDGKMCHVFYKPVENTGWSAAIVCPEHDIFRPFYRLRRTVTIMVNVCFLLMFFCFVRIIAGQLKPLHRLAQEAETVASGKFDCPLPDFDRIDEIGQLSQSFGEMQHSLVNYIAELTSTTAKTAAIENDLHVATDIQMSMLPRVFPPFPERKDIDLFASMTPAKEVGGDLYDFVLHDDCLYFTVGDVSGKGVPAALFMAQATRLFRTLADEGLMPEAIATRMNSGLCEGNDTMMFVTMFIGVIHLTTGQMEFCNCGHNPPVLDGQFINFKHKNRPLGLFDDLPFKGESIDGIFDKQLLVYTDGLNEAMNMQHEQFGDERIIAIIADSRELTACQLIEKLRAAVEQHRNGAAPNDDLTMLCLRIVSPQA